MDLDATRSYLDDLLEQVRKQQDALRFYADEGNWDAEQAADGTWEPGTAVDRGEYARAVLAGES